MERPGQPSCSFVLYDALLYSRYTPGACHPNANPPTHFAFVGLAPCPSTRSR